MERKVGLRQNPAVRIFVDEYVGEDFDRFGNDADKQHNLANALESQLLREKEQSNNQCQRNGNNNKVFGLKNLVLSAENGVHIFLFVFGFGKVNFLITIYSIAYFFHGKQQILLACKKNLAGKVRTVENNLRFLVFGFSSRKELADNQVDQSSLDDDALFHALAFQKGSNFGMCGYLRLNFFVRQAFREHHLCLNFAVYLYGILNFGLHQRRFVDSGVSFNVYAALFADDFPQLFRKVGCEGGNHLDKVKDAFMEEYRVLFAASDSYFCRALTYSIILAIEVLNENASTSRTMLFTAKFLT